VTLYISRIKIYTARIQISKEKTKQYQCYFKILFYYKCIFSRVRLLTTFVKRYITHHILVVNWIYQGKILSYLDFKVEIDSILHIMFALV
jgi:hypothetical protein